MAENQEYSLLKTFEQLFQGKPYHHRKSTQGDMIALQFYEDLVSLGKSDKISDRVKKHERVINLANVMTGKPGRRGDGTFGELVPAAIAISEKGFWVGRGPVATLEIGVETKILAKAMIKQIDRVIGDLARQVEEFKKHGNDVIGVGFVGINFAPVYVSFEGKRAEFLTDGKNYKHPIQEAPEAERRLINKAAPFFDEFQLLKFKATNIEPFSFEWMDEHKTRLEYSALLTRVSREYDKRFP